MKFLTPLRSVVASALVLASCSGGGGGNDRANGGLTSTFRTMAAHWNHEAVNASGYDHTSDGAGENLGPTKASRAMAIVHASMFDAANAASGQKYYGYRLQDNVAEASVEAAIAQAAYSSLSALFPSQEGHFRDQLNKDLAGIEDGEAKVLGIEVGSKAAALIVADRANDGAQDISQSAPYVFSNQPGKWRVDPTNPDQQPLGQNWDKVRPFVIKSSSQFRAPAPPSLTSTEYAEAFAEVYRLGGDAISTPTERTEDQTNIGLFWAYDGTPSLCAPPRLYNQIAMEIASQRGMTDNLELTRLLAMLNVALADAGITSWETKFHYDYWRPITAIRESDAGTGPTGKGDGNSLTFGDVTWTPLGAPASNLSARNFTPPFPSYVSGHATFGGALFQVLRNYFGTDEIPFTFVSDELNGETIDNHGDSRPYAPRSYPNLTAAENENADSRVYLGIHFRFDQTQGTIAGNKVANYVTAHVFQPRK